jgi:hypothetical protein
MQPHNLFNPLITVIAFVVGLLAGAAAMWSLMKVSEKKDIEEIPFENTPLEGDGFVDEVEFVTRRSHSLF